MELLNNRLYLFLLLFLLSCNGELLESLSHNTAPGRFCPNVRMINGNCPDDFETLKWDFSNKDHYNFNSNYVEISNGQASLKIVDQHHLGDDFINGQFIGTYLDQDRKLVLNSSSSEVTHVNNIIPSRSNSLVGYWRFEGDYSNATGNGPDGTPSGDITLDTDAKLGEGSGLFGGSNGVVDFGPSEELEIHNDITIQAWIKTTSGAYGMIAQKYSGSERRGFLLSTSGDGLYARLDGRDMGNIYRSSGYSETIINDGQWHHLVGQRKGSLWKIYVDGSLESSHDSQDTSSIANQTSAFRIGDYNSSTYFEGRIDEVAIWDYALEDNDILNLYQFQKGSFSSLSPLWTPRYSDIVGYWTMDGHWLDQSGNNNHGTANGGITFDEDNRAGGSSALFDGIDDSISIADSDSLDIIDDFTFSAWIKPSSFGEDIGGGSLYGRIFRKFSHFDFRLQHLNGSSPAIAFGNNTGSELVYESNSLNSLIGRWSHIVATRIGSTSYLYIDGQLILSSANGVLGSPNGGNLLIGDHNTSPRHFEGKIDEVFIMSSGLSSSNVKEIYNRQKQKFSGHFDSPIINLGTQGPWSTISSQTPLPFYKEILSLDTENIGDYSSIGADLSNDLVGYWKFNEKSVNTVSGNDVEDFSVNQNHGNEQGSVSMNAQGIINRGFLFDGVDDSIDFADIHDLGLSDYSFSTWIKTTSNSSTASYLLSKSRLASGNGRYGIGIINCRVRVLIDLDASYLQDGNIQVCDDQWHHIVVVYDRDANMSLYIDNVLDFSLDISSGSLINANTSYPFRIGSYSDSSATLPDRFFSGHIDEVAVWRRTLSEVEIKQLYRRAANRIKYQVRSCIDPNCHCKSYSLIPEGTSLDCDGDGIVNSLDHSDSHIAEFIGPGGSGDTYYSELFNRAPIDITSTCDLNTSDNDDDICLSDEIDLLGESLSTAPSFVFNNMAASASILDNQYFQYKVIMEAQENSACAGSACLPELTSVEVTPRERFFTGSPVIKSSIPIKYVDILEMKFSEGGQCNLTYQLSSDGITYYYHDGARWVVAASEVSSLSSNAVVTSKYIASFVETVGSGSLYFKAFMNSDGSQSCVIEEINLRHYY